MGIRSSPSLRAWVAHVGDGMPQEIGDRHARDHRRILKRQEDSGLRPLVGFERQQINSIERDRTGRDLVIRVPHQGVAEGALAGAVRTHQGVHLALAERQIHPAQDLFFPDGHVQIFDRKNFAH